METEIKFKGKNVLFRDIEIGDAFYYRGIAEMPYMKIFNDSSEDNAVCLVDGTLMNFEADDQVNAFSKFKFVGEI